MAWYVFALVDERPRSRQGSGLAGPLAARAVAGAFAIVERRGDVPPVDFGTLRKHDAVVTRLAGAVPAILPVRFGTLLEMEEIEDSLADRDEEIADAFDAVRDRVQFTWRRARGASGARSARGAQGARSAQGAAGAAQLSGTEYLRRAAGKQAPPAAFRGPREKLRPLVAAERYQPATASLPDSLYHLVDRGAVERYQLLAQKLASASPALRVTGPFPPFAFTPDLL